jgi:PIN domain nuclease of toxin-antitoxin system
MNLLLDTHILLWWLDDPAQLSEAARTAIGDDANVVFVSAATAWEIVIKQGLGKLDAPDNLDEVLRECRFTPLPITIAHALAVQSLPMHHRDPFDRMLVAQAAAERMTIVTRDPKVLEYAVSNIVA